MQGAANLAPTAVILEETEGLWGGRLVIFSCLGGGVGVCGMKIVHILIFFAEHPFL